MSEVLILQRANASRSSRQWSDDDYDAMDGKAVGHVYKDHAGANDDMVSRTRPGPLKGWVTQTSAL